MSGTVVLTVASSRQFVDWPLGAAVVAVKADDRCRSRDWQATLRTDDSVLQLDRLNVHVRTFRADPVGSNDSCAIVGRSDSAADDR